MSGGESLSYKFIDHSDEVQKALDSAIEAALEAIGNQAVSHAKTNITEAGRVDTGAKLEKASLPVVKYAQRAIL